MANKDNKKILYELSFNEIITDARIYDIENMEKSADGIVLKCGNIDPQIYLSLSRELEKPIYTAVCEITYSNTNAGFLQVFWDYGEGLSETNSTKEYIAESLKTTSIDLPIVNWENGKKLVALGVDPPDVSVFVLKTIKFLIIDIDSFLSNDVVKLHLACGPKYKEGWINIDNEPTIKKLDLNWDLRFQLPFPDNSVDFIYNEHFLEHLTVEEGLSAIRDFYRVLKPNGVMRIAMPDLEKTVTSYFDKNWKKNNRRFLEKVGLTFIQTRAERINISFRWWGHKWLYDWEELERRLKESGCEKIKRCKIFKSEHETLKKLETRNESTLIAEVIKTSYTTNKPLVSICCLAYNHAPFIRQCLDGFIMQKTNFPIEVLIHDDASTDGTADIIREYEKKYPNIIKPIYQTENQYSKGVKISITYNFPRVQGRYIAMCEGDDYWTDDCYLKNGITFLEQHNEYNCYVTDSIHKGSDFQISGINAQNKQLDQVGHDISFDNYVYFHTSARIYRNIFNFSKVLKHPYSGEIYLYYIFLDKGKVYFDHKVTSVYNITGNGAWSKLTQNEKEQSMFKVSILATNLLNNRYYNFFWESSPKTKLHRAIKKLVGKKITMKFLCFLYFPKYYFKRK